MARTIDENRPYKRIIPSTRESAIMKQNGFTPLFSSNVSAASKSNEDLYIRFWNGSIYRYPNQAKNFERLVGAASKGKWVWRFLRRKNVPYQKVGSLPLDQDLDITDEELFEDVSSIKVEDVRNVTIEQLDIFNLAAMGVINNYVEPSILGDITVGIALGQVNLM